MIGYIFTSIIMFIGLACIFRILLNELHTLIFVDLKKIKDENKD